MKHKIFKAIEQDIKINNILSHRTNLTDWKSFTRTHFNLIAKEINKNVSSYVQENPILIYDYLLLGKDKVEKLKFDHNLDTSEELIDQLDLTSVNKPFNWISGKTLERYWNELDVKPKDLKLNVLLSYLQVSIKDWEEWKYYSSSSLDSKELNNISNEKILNESNSSKDHIFLKNIKNYYLGSYYLYYLKTDNKSRIVKTPFIIKTENDKIIIESTSEGYRYKSVIIKRMMNNLYVLCRNLDWEEEESYLFNIGLETKPEVIFGVSITLTAKSGIPVAIKNILIKQSSDVHLLDNESEKEIKINNESKTGLVEEDCVIKYFERGNDTKLMFAEYCNTFSEFKESLEEL